MNLEREIQEITYFRRLFYYINYMYTFYVIHIYTIYEILIKY
jgi:hypothetical protein